MLRKAKVVGKFVEFFGPGAAALPVVDRATIANMAPEYGATMGFFPIDAECVNYLRATGRSEEHCRIYENYYRAQGLFGIPKKGRDRLFDVELELDLATVVPSVAGPKRPQDRIELPNLKREFVAALHQAGYRKRIWQARRRTWARASSRGPRDGLPGGRRQPGTGVTPEATAARNTNPATELEMANNRPTPDAMAARGRRAREATSATAACSSPRSRVARTRPTRP